MIISQSALRGKSTAKFLKLNTSRLPIDVLRHSMNNISWLIYIMICATLKLIGKLSMKTLRHFTLSLDKHAPIKIRRVKSSRLPDWYSPEIGQARIARDRCKHWTEYKYYRNKTRNLIRKAKGQHFTKSIENFKDTSTLWKHLRAVNNGSTSSSKTLPDE